MALDIVYSFHSFKSQRYKSGPSQSFYLIGTEFIQWKRKRDKRIYERANNRKLNAPDA